MMASSFTKAFRLIALVLVVALAQVYVMAGPVKALTDPRGNKASSDTQPKAETVVSESKAATPSVESQMLTPAAAAERMPVTAGSKTVLNRIFSKGNVEARLAAGNTFLKAKASGADLFKAPGKALAPDEDDNGDSGGGGSKGTWIAVGVIAAVLTIAIIGLRHDRHAETQPQ